VNKLLTIAVPTYARPEALLRLWREVLNPLLQLHPDILDISIQDNSVSTDLYPSTFLVAVSTSARYVLNGKNIGYHGNILALLRTASSRYIWFWSDDDDYDLLVVSDLISKLQEGVLTADVILPPFSYSRHKEYLSSHFFPSPERLATSAVLLNGYAVRTNFESLLEARYYPYVPLTSSLIIKIDPRPDENVLASHHENAWLHEVVMLSCASRATTIELLYCKPFVYYEESFDEHGKPLKSGMSISYYHDSYLKLCRLRSIVFNQKSLYSEVKCWTGTLLWLLQQKDNSVNWSNNYLAELRLSLSGLCKGLQLKSTRLISLSAAYLLLPSFAIRWLRRIRRSGLL
jgi:hypothetical protein